MRIAALGAATLLFTSFLLTSLFGASGTAIAVSIAFVLVAVTLIRAIDRYVLRPGPGLLRERRVLLATTVASGACIASLALALPTNPSFLQVTVGAIFLAGVSSALLGASGGRDTWGTFFGKSREPEAERG